MAELQLLKPVKIGDLEIKNRMVMAPMTRSRATEGGNKVSDITVEYYRQRASAGLIITEGTQVSTEGVGYVFTPGIYSNEQVEAWKKVTDAVHEQGGKIFAQLWHVGRISHSSFHGGNAPLAPSAIAAEGQTYTYEGVKDFSVPKAMGIDDIKRTVNDFGKAAENAKKAGFDGVEIHGANGYLLEQFLSSGANQRTDEYGGSIENRTRFVLEVVEEVIKVWGDGRVGIKLSPGGTFNSTSDANREETWGYLINKLNNYNLAYVHLQQADTVPEGENGVQDIIKHFRAIYKGTLIGNVGFTRETGNQLIEEGLAEFVSFGKFFLANPDLPKRFELNAPLNDLDPQTLYVGGTSGYTDYPFLNN